MLFRSSLEGEFCVYVFDTVGSNFWSLFYSEQLIKQGESYAGPTARVYAYASVRVKRAYT